MARRRIVGIVGTVLTVGIGLGAMVIASSSATRAHVEPRIGDVNLRIDDVDTRIDGLDRRLTVVQMQRRLAVLAQRRCDVCDHGR